MAPGLSRAERDVDLADLDVDLPGQSERDGGCAHAPGRRPSAGPSHASALPRPKRLPPEQVAELIVWSPPSGLALG
jgi:hypothetical protein